MRTVSVRAIFFSLALLCAACGAKEAQPNGEAPKVVGEKGTPEEAAKTPEKVEAKVVRVLTASPDGNYFKIANQLAQAMAGSEHKLDVRTSPGSFHNVSELGKGKTDLAIAQFDTIMVYIGLGEEGKKAVDSTMAVAPLGEEFIHILVRKESGIKTIADLEGKRIAVGPHHSGSWVSAWNVMYYLNGKDIEKGGVKVTKENYQSSIDKLVSGELDALFITTSPGMPLLKSLPDEKANAISMLALGEDFELSEKLSLAYSIREIPAGTYPFDSGAVRTLATRSYLLAGKSFPKEDVKKMAAVIYGGAEKLMAVDPVWSLLSEKHIKSEMNKVPYHDGVLEHMGLKRP
jgi:hypothetical protein